MTKALGGALVLLILLIGFGPALATTRCVQGTEAPPPNCLTYSDIYAAQAVSVYGDEIRVYGTTPTPTTVTMVAAKLTGILGPGLSRGTLDGTGNLGSVVLRYAGPRNYQIKNLDVLTSGDPGGTGIEFGQTGQVKWDGVRVIGPKGGLGVGINILPGAGRVTMYGNSSDSFVFGQAVGLRSTSPAGRPSPNGVDFFDVTIGIESIGVPLAQWFHTEITCARPNSIGFRSVVEHADHNQMDIAGCSVGIQIECVGGVCGRGNEWDFVRIDTLSACPDSTECVAVRTIQRDGTVVDDYKADPNCGDAWGGSDTINGAFIQKFAVRC